MRTSEKEERGSCQRDAAHGSASSQRNQQSGAIGVAQSGKLVADMVRLAARLRRVKEERCLSANHRVDGCDAAGVLV
jgi:hypothetical protein